MKDITREWLNSAKEDLLAIEEMIDKEYLSSIIAFHSQQTIEKCFKAIIEEKELELPKIHDLIKLYDSVKSYLKFDVDITLLTELTELYTNSRYPGEFATLPNGKPTIHDAKRFYEFAEYIYNSIQNYLEKHGV